MSMSEVFSGCNTACRETESLGKNLVERYPRWVVLVVLRRVWLRDKRINRLYAPAFLMVFGSSVDFGSDITATSDGAQWMLLFYDVKHSCQEILWESKGAELIGEIFRSVPSDLHPSSFSVVCVTAGDTHERLGLFSDRAFLLFKERLGHTLLPLRLQQISFQRYALVMDGTEKNNGFSSLLEKTIQLLLCKTPEAADVSAPSQKGNDLILSAFLELNPLLYTATFQEPSGSVQNEEVDIPETSGDAPFRPRKVSRQAGNNSKKRVGHVATFTLPSVTTSDDAGPVWHVLLIQRPIIEKQEVSLENLDPGPLEPQSISPEIHLLQDGGEVLYLKSELCDERAFEVVYGDIMHEDGELFLQLTPLEGIAFDDIDRYLNFISSQGEKAQCSKETRTGPLYKGSCSSYTFPKVVFRRPTGSVVKDTAISSPHVKIVEESPHSPEQWEAARLAFSFLSQHIVPIDCGYTLASDVAPVPPPTHGEKCAWCHRRREKLLRCGGCQVEMYCCKKHQMMDWKDGHRRTCGLWRKARYDYELRVLPLLQAKQAELPTTPSASAVVTLLKFLVENLSEARLPTTPIVHVLGIDQDVMGFLPELAQRVTECRERWEQLRLLFCSDSIEEEEHNAVYAISVDGIVTRTMPTSVLGDEWHIHSAGGASDAAMLIRLYNTKYHVFIDTSSNMGGVRDKIAPSAVACFGSPTGDGMTYFTAAAEVLASHFLGVIPVMCAEPTFVGAHRTLDALLARLKSTSAIGADRRIKLLTRQCNPDDLIQLNTSGVGCRPLGQHLLEAASILPTWKQQALVQHPNLYYFIIPVV